MGAVKQIWGRPAADLSIWGRKPAQIWGREIDRLGPSVEGIPSPNYYWPFESDDIDVVGGLQYEAIITGNGHYGNYGALATGDGDSVTQSLAVSNLSFGWYLIGGVWSFVGTAVSGGSLVLSRRNSTVYSDGQTAPAWGANGADEVALIVFSPAITAEAAASILETAYNNGNGVVYRDDQWQEIAQA